MDRDPFGWIGPARNFPSTKGLKMKDPNRSQHIQIADVALMCVNKSLNLINSSFGDMHSWWKFQLFGCLLVFLFFETLISEVTSCIRDSNVYPWYSLMNDGSFETPLTWRIIQFSKWLITRWLVSPLTGVSPLPNGRTSWLINGGDPNYLRYLGWSSKYPNGATSRLVKYPDRVIKENNLYEPWSEVVVLGMVIQPLIGNPYNGYINPYYKVDDHPLLYGNIVSLDPGTYTLPPMEVEHFRPFWRQQKTSS